MTEVQAGRFTAITAMNVPKAENVSFSSNLPGSPSPVFYQENENAAVALLPIGLDTPDGVYELTFEYGATTAHVPLTVINYGFAPVSYNVYDSVVQATRNSAAATIRRRWNSNEWLPRGSRPWRSSAWRCRR